MPAWLTFPEGEFRVVNPEEKPFLDTMTPPVLFSQDMTLLHEAVDAKKFDNRVVARNVDRGVVTPGEAQKITDGLPDDAANAEYVSIEEIAQSEGSGRKLNS